MVGLWTTETIQMLLASYRQRGGNGAGGGMGSARGGALGAEIAWGVASLCEQYGLSGGLRGGRISRGALLQQPAARRAFEALVRWAAAA